SWFRAGGITDEFRQGYVTACAVGPESPSMATSVVTAVVAPLLKSKRLTVGIDDTPTQRYGPCVAGAGIHHPPRPGPRAEGHLYGQLWVVLPARAKHDEGGPPALPRQAQRSIRAMEGERLPPERARPFRTKLELASEQLRWLKPWVERRFEELGVAVEG